MHVPSPKLAADLGEQLDRKMASLHLGPASSVTMKPSGPPSAPFMAQTPRVSYPPAPAFGYTTAPPLAPFHGPPSAMHMQRQHPPALHSMGSFSAGTAHLGAQHPQEPAMPCGDTLSRHVKLATFDGTENVESFVKIFEMGCTFLGVPNDAGRLVLLHSSLKGTALAWASTEMDQDGISYVHLKNELIENFKSEGMSKVRQLQELRQGSRSIYDHNTKFMALAAAAGKSTHPSMVKDHYIDSL